MGNAERTILFCNTLASIEISKSLRPNWLGKNENVKIFLPAIYKNDSKGQVLSSFIINNKKYPAIVKEKNRLIFNFNPKETISFLLNEKYVQRKRPFYTYLPFHYHKLPFRSLLGKLLSLSKKQKEFPGWPAEKSVELIRHFIKCKKPKWPHNKKFAIAITHDVDSAKGQENIEKFSKIEEKYGLTSTWNIVASYYDLNDSLLKSLIKKGHEIACHGYNHDNKTPYLSPNKIKYRLEKCKEMLKKYNVRGFRASSLLLSQELSKQIHSHFVYDSSVPDTEACIPDADSSGCCSVFPFKKENTVEIPLTVPMDSSLVFAGYKPTQILEIWKKKIEYIKKVGGIAVITTHPENHFSANKEMLGIYNRLMDYVSKQKDAWIANMSEVAEFWKKQ